MAKSKTVRVSEEELVALQVLRQNAKASDPAPTEKERVVTESQQVLVDALAAAIERTRPPTKKTIANRTPQTPWMPTDGSPRLKLKRKMYHHGVAMSDKLSNTEIDLLNKVKPGIYCEGHVRVVMRKDRGLDIDYPVRTNSQRLKLVNTYGIRNFSELLQRLIDEKANPKQYIRPGEEDLYDLE